MSSVLAIDPGPEKSAWVIWDGARVWDVGITPNEELRKIIRCRLWIPTVDIHLPQRPVILTPMARSSGERRDAAPDHLAIEKIESFGMAVGAEVFETVFWTGRLVELWGEERASRVTRREVKLHLCGSARAKDANIRQRLIDLLGAPGTRKAPGPTFGVTSHAWSALAVAVTWWETQRARQ